MALRQMRRRHFPRLRRRATPSGSMVPRAPRGDCAGGADDSRSLPIAHMQCPRQDLEPAWKVKGLAAPPGRRCRSFHRK